MPTTTIFDVQGVVLNQTPFISPNVNFPSSKTSATLSLVLQSNDLTDTSLTVNIKVQTSQDGGNTWHDDMGLTWTGGPLPTNPNFSSQPMLVADLRSLDNKSKVRLVGSASRQITVEVILTAS